MRRLNPLIAILVALAVPVGMLLTAAPALASTSGTIYKECEQNGQITGNFTAAQLKAALNGLPSEVSEYSDCQDLIQQALVRVSSTTGGGHTGSGKAHAAGAKSGRGGGPGKGSGNTGKTGSSTAKDGRAGRKGGGNAATLAGSDIRPGSTESSGSSSSLPVALIVVLILLALTAVSGGVVAIRRRVDARHST
jgi:hypothetical protein